MRRITIWIASTLSALVLLFSYHTSTSATAASSVLAGANTASGSTSTSTPSPSASSGSGESSSSSSSPSASSGSSTSTSTTYTGDAVGTRYGDVQVEITVVAGKVTAAQVLQVPWSNRKDQQINAAAVPVLNDEAVSAQSASIDMVSGATYTSEGYIGSLQSALDQANL